MSTVKCARLLLIVIICILATYSHCFVPLKLIRAVIDKSDDKLRLDFGETSETLTHEDIIKRGIINSVAKYMVDNPINKSNVSLTKLANGDYYNIRTLYSDYYGRSYCTINLDIQIKTVYQTNVALVDLDSKTKDNPDAHFDAERFFQSNRRVIDFTERIYSKLSNQSYTEAAALAGQIMHTVQDFYSHSNWIEMGNVDKINTQIGNESFNYQPVATQSDNLTCVSNCTLVNVTCTTLVNIVVDLIRLVGIKNVPFTCPIQYYVCKGNVVKLDKLVSGYYVGQALSDGTGISKPVNGLKCSHGGLVDTDAFKPATGGMNKDSGYYLFSPRADLHLTAAKLAIKHTEFYFDQIRQRIGNKEFATFLQLAPDDNVLNFVNQYLPICSRSNSKPSPVVVFILSCMIMCLVTMRLAF